MATTTGAANTIWLDVADAPPIAGIRFRRPRGDDADYDAMAAVITALGVDADNPTGALGLYEDLGFEVDLRSTAYWAPLPR